MLRRDGKFTFYIVEHQYKGKGEWSFSGDCQQWTKNVPLDDKYIGVNPHDGSPILKPYFQSFRASGRCWQETGVHGTYEEQHALDVMQIIAKYNPDHNFRVVKVIIQQEAEVISNCSYRGAKRNKG